MIKCTFENGGKASLRHCIVNLLIIKEGKILLVKRAPHLTNPNMWGLVGGFVDRDETIKEAGEREAVEETGYKIKMGNLLTIIDNPKRPKEDRQNIAFIYIAEGLEKVGEGDKESSEVKWFDFNDLPPENEFAFDHYGLIQQYLGKKLVDGEGFEPPTSSV